MRSENQTETEILTEKPKHPAKTKKRKKNLCEKQKVMLTKKNRLALFVKGLGKKVK